MNEIVAALRAAGQCDPGTVADPIECVAAQPCDCVLRQMSINEIERLDANVTTFSFQHTLDRECIAELLDALTEAKRTIKALHGPTAWDIYEMHAPEMKKINAALNSTAGGICVC